MSGFPTTEYDLDMVWYAAYGSNLQYERLLCYINGKKPAGASRKQRGMSDRTPPAADFALAIPHGLYFADRSDSWGGGVAFITSQASEKAKTLCRVYLIRRRQFVDLFAQENQEDTDRVDIDFGKLNARGHLKAGNAWYSLVLKVGEKAGRPVYTFTRPVERLSERTRPSESYLGTVVCGLMECWSETKKDDLIQYLLTATGETYERNQLAALFEKCEKEYTEAKKRP